MDLEDLLTNKWTYIIGIIVILGIIGGITDCSDSKKNEAKSAEAYITAVANNDFTEAHLILNKLQADYLQYPNSKSTSEKFWNAANYIYKDEMQALLPQNDPEADKRLLYTLDNFTPVGKKPIPDQGYGYDDNKHVEAYIGYIQGYNTLCLEMIRIALRYENINFANEVLYSMKDNFIENNYEDGKHYFRLDDSLKEEGKKVIKEYQERH